MLYSLEKSGVEGQVDHHIDGQPTSLPLPIFDLSTKIDEVGAVSAGPVCLTTHASKTLVHIMSTFSSEGRGIEGGLRLDTVVLVHTPFFGK